MILCSSKKRNKHKKQIASNENNSEVLYVNEEGKNDNAVTAISIQELKQAMEVFSLNTKPAKTSDDALKKNYQFWSTQPVPRLGKLCQFKNIYQHNLELK